MLTEISLSIPASDLSPAERAQLLVPTLAALSDENRLTILRTLAETSLTNRQLHEATGMSQALVSHHLAPLRKAGLVDSEPRGRVTRNSVCCAQLADQVRWLANLATSTTEGQRGCWTDSALSNEGA